MWEQPLSLLPFSKTAPLCVPIPTPQVLYCHLFSLDKNLIVNRKHFWEGRRGCERDLEAKWGPWRKMNSEWLIKLNSIQCCRKQWTFYLAALHLVFQSNWRSFSKKKRRVYGLWCWEPSIFSCVGFCARKRLIFVFLSGSWCGILP